MADSFLTVSQGALIKNGEAILSDLNFSIPKGDISVILGPSSTGKTLLLQAISNSLYNDVHYQGTWQRDETDSAASSPPLFPQRTYRVNPRAIFNDKLITLVTSWQQALDQGSNIVFLDEPIIGTNQEAYQPLIQQLKARAKDQTIILVTHNIKLAKAVADHIIFICAGKINSSGPAEDFYSTPPTDMAQKFLRSGNCWPGPDPLPLPNHFRWIIPNQLAGMGKPGLLGDADQDLEAVGHAGISLLVSLTETPYSPEHLRSFGIQARHFPIIDMKVPSLNATATLVAQMAKRIRDQQAIAYHCKAGLGRTGTLLACHLCWTGSTPDEAVALIRSKQPGYIQNKTQMDFVYQFADRYCSKATESIAPK